MSKDNEDHIPYLSKGAQAAIKALSAQHGYSTGELVALGLSIAKLVLDEREKHNRLILTTAEGTPLGEFVLPEPEPRQPTCTALAPFDLLRRAMPS